LGVNGSLARMNEGGDKPAKTEKGLQGEKFQKGVYGWGFGLWGELGRGRGFVGKESIKKMGGNKPVLGGTGKTKLAIS